MLFSEYFNIKCLGDEDWFNPILTQDTLLFIDPFAVFKSKDELSDKKLNELFKLLESNIN